MPKWIVRALVASAFAVLVSLSAQAQTLTIYDDALQNTFQNYSYADEGDPLPNFDSIEQPRTGTKSIRFPGTDFNAISFFYPGADLSTATYPVLRFWIHGGATGGQRLEIYIANDGGYLPNTDLTPYITGGSVVAGEWREVVVNLTQAPFNAVSFDRIDVQSYQAGAQGVLYVDDVTLGQVTTPVVGTMTIEHDVTVSSMVSDRFTWKDSSNQTRVAVLAHNNQSFNTARGGALREFRYQLPGGATRTANVTTYGNAGYAGFGYVVSHASRSACAGDDSPLGGKQAGNGFERVFEGRHHAIFRFRQNYPRNCGTTGALARTMPVTIDWMFTTGQDHPLWAVTFDVDQATAVVGGAVAPANTFWDDSRAPYGELNIDGFGYVEIDGTAWGDRWKFTNTTSPIKHSSPWTWNVANTIPYVKEWLAGPLTVDNQRDATMGIVQTQTLDQQDAGGARDPDVGSDIRTFWNTTSANGNACGVIVIPCGDDWPYQANGNSVDADGSNNARLTWKTQYGFLGQNSYTTNNGGPVTTAPGYPKKSYSTWIVLGTHSTLPVEAQVTQVETIQSLTLSTITGSVVTSGPAGITRADNATYAPAGYNHVYGALAFSATGNLLDANIAVGAGTLKKPLIIISNYTGADPTVKLGGVTLTQDADYFHSLRAGASELWLTLSANLTGAVNHLEISGAACGAPATPTGVTATAVLATQINVSWVAVAGADSYEVDRMGPDDDEFGQVGTPAGSTFSDLTAAADTAYLYRVRAVNGSGESANSASDLATTVIFTDDPLVAITIKATHLSQLRKAVNAVRDLVDLDPAAFTDAAPAGVTIKAVHVTELRMALDAARTILGLSTGGYTDAAPAGLAVKELHVTELRARTK